MPSNAELVADIDALSTELGQTVNVTGLKNDQLAKLLAGLRDEKSARAETPAPGAAEQAAAEQAAAPVVKPYYMAPGKAVTSKAGILDGGTADEVKAEYFEGGAETLQALVDDGYVLKS